MTLPRAPREEAWRRLGTDLPLDRLDSTVSEVGLSDLTALAPKILKGEVRGRVVVDVARTDLSLGRTDERLVSRFNDRVGRFHDIVRGQLDHQADPAWVARC